MWSINRYAYVLADPLFYESLDRYTPDEGPYAAVVRRLLPDDWRMTKSSIWFNAAPPTGDRPLQGWKIHVSATISTADAVLNLVVPVLVANGVAFKFAGDPTLHRLLLGKRWPRGSAGKFITIYPQSQPQFLELLDQLHAATQSIKGPYILSDRRYSDSSCIFYRYGSFAKRTDLRLAGDQSPYMVSPDGRKVPDVRKAWCAIPEWVADPFPQERKPSSGPKSIGHGRYLVDAVLHFSNAGGVYRGTDTTTGMPVVIKEARPGVTLDGSGTEAVESLQKEYRILQKVAAADIAPQPIELFKEWEHHFLVEEYLTDGMEIRHHATSHSFARYTCPTEQEPRDSLAVFKAVFISLTHVLSTLHAHGVAFRDLSPSNVMIMPGPRAKLVDFEAACEVGVDKPSEIFTPGFAAADQFASEFARFESDYFALGALMLLYLAPIHPMIGLDGDALCRFAAAVADDYGVPADIRDLVVTLLSRKPSHRPDPPAVLRTLESPGPIRPLRINEVSEFDEEDTRRFLTALTGAIMDAARYDRQDRLFPADPKVFVTNPLSLAYGACGVAYALKTINGEAPDRVLEWIDRHEVTPEAYPPGLYAGMAGIAWSLLELDRQEKAEEILLASYDHPLLFESADFFYGISGWGMANLKMSLATGRPIYLERAREAGEWIVRNAVETDKGFRWNQPGEKWLGLGHGSSGVSLFLLYLYLATGEARFLSVGRRGLDAELSHAVPFCGALSWPVQDRPGPTIVPYWRYGSVGVGAAVLRYLHVTGDESLRPYLDGISRDAARKYAIFPGRFFGLAGLGDFLLDVADFEPDSAKYVDGAKRVAAGIRLFEIKREGCRCGFPGFDLWKVSCDYGSGGAGIGLFFHRLLTRRGPEFMVDELLRRADRTRGPSPAPEGNQYALS